MRTESVSTVPFTLLVLSPHRTHQARLIAPALDKRDWASGYKWVIEALKQDHDSIASEMEIEKALKCCL